MAESKTEIANLALSNIAHASEIASFDDMTEKSSEAQAVRRAYKPALDATFRDLDWGFARSRLELALLVENPTPAYGCGYTYPTECAFFRAIEGETESNPIPFEVWRHAGKRIIATNAAQAVGIYTAYVDDCTQYPPDFTLAFSWRLAATIAVRLTKAEDRIAAAALRQYEMEIAKAAANSLNEERKKPSTSSSFSRSRGWGR